MFKVGQKVVYKRNENREMHPMIIRPKNYEIVTIIGPSMFRGDAFYLKEYPTSIDGRAQCFHYSHFRPLDYAFVEEVIKQVQPEKQPA